MYREAEVIAVKRHDTVAQPPGGAKSEWLLYWCPIELLGQRLPYQTFSVYCVYIPRNWQRSSKSNRMLLQYLIMNLSRCVDVNNLQLTRRCIYRVSRESLILDSSMLWQSSVAEIHNR